MGVEYELEFASIQNGVTTIVDVTAHDELDMSQSLNSSFVNSCLYSFPSFEVLSSFDRESWEAFTNSVN